MAAEVSIRFARAADAQVVWEFIHALAEYEHEPDAVKATPESLRSQMTSDDPPFECLIAEQDGNAIGFALFYRTFSTWTGRPGLYLEDLFVAQELRHAGIGRMLMRRLAQIAAERGYARMQWSVLNWNQSAIEFYKSLGALAEGDWKVWRLEGTSLTQAAGP